MRVASCAAGLIAICFVAGVSYAQSKTSVSLCSLKEGVADGEHISVRASGMYSVGLENSTLEDPACPFVPYGATWVDFDLSTKRNDKKLRTLLEHSGQVYLSVEGDLYGRPLPDPNLPEAIRKSYQPNWGHLNCCSTKLVVHVIRDVKAPPVSPPTDGSH